MDKIELFLAFKHENLLHREEEYQPEDFSNIYPKKCMIRARFIYGNCPIIKWIDWIFTLICSHEFKCSFTFCF